MITNFKLFEKTSITWSKSELLYNKNDYVLIDIDEIKINNEKELIAGTPSEDKAKITKINIHDKYPYHVIFSNNETLQLPPMLQTQDH